MKLMIHGKGCHNSANSYIVRESVKLLQMNLLNRAHEGHVVHSNTEWRPDKFTLRLFCVYNYVVMLAPYTVLGIKLFLSTMFLSHI